MADGVSIAGYRSGSKVIDTGNGLGDVCVTSKKFVKLGCFRVVRFGWLGARCMGRAQVRVRESVDYYHHCTPIDSLSVWDMA